MHCCHEPLQLLQKAHVLPCLAHTHGHSQATVSTLSGLVKRSVKSCFQGETFCDDATNIWLQNSVCLMKLVEQLHI